MPPWTLGLAGGVVLVLVLWARSESPPPRADTDMAGTDAAPRWTMRQWLEVLAPAVAFTLGVPMLIIAIHIAEEGPAELDRFLRFISGQSGYTLGLGVFVVFAVWLLLMLETSD